MRSSIPRLAFVAMMAACTEHSVPTQITPTDSLPPSLTIAPADGDRILLDLRSSLQQAQTMRDALVPFGISADSRANWGFTTNMDGAGTHALRVDWPNAAGACTSISPSLGTTFPAPAPTRLAISWKQRLGRTATGGGLGDVATFDVVRPECGSAGRFVIFVDRTGTSNRIELKWNGGEPGTPALRAKSSMSNAVTPNQGWSFAPQAVVGKVMEQTLYVRPESAPGAADGVLRLWVNDRLLIDAGALPLGAEALAKFVLPWTSPAPLRDQSEYVWDIVAWQPAVDLTGPGAPPPPPPPPPPPAASVATVTVSPASATIAVGQTVQLSATARDSAGNVLTGRATRWTSADAAVASVSASGLVTGVSANSTTVAATIDGKSGAAAISVSASSPPPPPPAPGAGWYVSPTGSSAGAGTAASPWDLQTALNGAGGKVLPGDTVWIRGGTYPNGGSLTRSGSSAAQITFSGVPGETAIIRQQFSGTASYVTIRNLIFEGPINAATNQVYLHSCHHVVFTRNEIRNGDFHAGLSVDESNNMTITYNYIHDNGIDTHIDHGIYFKTTTGPGSVIANNLLVHNAARGLSLHDNSGVGVYDVVVANNTIVGNGSTGINVNEADRITLVNNIAVGNGDKTGQAQIRIKAGNNNKIWNNLTWHASVSSRAGIDNETTSEMTGNRIGDPLFASYLGDLRLRSGSTAIGMALIGWTFGKDYAGKNRDGAPDVGAYEY